ncbi:MAG: hypothetical protein WB586_17970 [Chthoniobacterales bacterium]
MPAAEPFPGIGFQITTQEIPIDDLPCYEQEQTRLEFRSYWLIKQTKVIGGECEHNKVNNIEHSDQ